MLKTLLEDLMGDADLVANVGVRIGRLQGTDLLTALSNARQALDSDAVTPAIVAELQKSLNTAVRDIAPITLRDLRSGWTPFAAHEQRRHGTWLFGVFSLMLIVATAYTTQVYDRARALYATTIELQETRGAEQATRLFGLLRRNQADVIDSLTSGKKDFLYEAFSKALSDLQVMNLKFLAYAPVANEVMRDLDMPSRLKNSLFGNSAHGANPTNDPRIEAFIANYAGAKGPPDAGAAHGGEQEPPLALDAGRSAIPSLLQRHIKELREFNAIINVGFDPLVPIDYSYNIVPLRDSMRFLGSWVLPALYGMLGAVLFHMRRLLDPNLPNPSFLRFGYRIVLGGFAGIIVVWFWTPAAPKLSAAEFATLSSFGVAFLVGFSTDVFFQALDRLVTYLSQAVGQAGGRPA